MALWASLVRLAVLCLALYMSVRIRLFAVERYGRVIHEFDPWFNFRATEYMVANGWDKFQVRARAAPGARAAPLPRRSARARETAQCR